MFAWLEKVYEVCLRNKQLDNLWDELFCLCLAVQCYMLCISHC